ncbi:hypothetical protein CALCODRAFT_24242 [Calocera cornea HHB12733]|uniref:Uncharacterized protein n=1 Tax=Calocera cornea HHB12733 TaxID=1353952 RepID=A0A165J1A2_9BASI|nr:hypothetical protein CALCODRAFT_24242 [Calocera cornea HHB12733]
MQRSALSGRLKGERVPVGAWGAGARTERGERGGVRQRAETSGGVIDISTGCPSASRRSTRGLSGSAACTGQKQKRAHRPRCAGRRGTRRDAALAIFQSPGACVAKLKQEEALVLPKAEGGQNAVGMLGERGGEGERKDGHLTRRRSFCLTGKMGKAPARCLV